ncbi:MAG: XdhC family aldehyde oxidoreductase maturation factor [Desulfomonilaceae bacterium]
MGRLVQTICKLLENGEDLVLATILSHEGSTPRTAGTKMVIRSGGDSIATVGGGLVEAEVVQIADEVFRTRSAQIKAFDLTGVNMEGMDLVCGGRLEILVEFVTAGPANLQVFQGLSRAMSEGKKTYLVADLGGIGESPKRVDRCLIGEDGTVCGSACAASVTEIVKRWTGKERYPTLVAADNHRYMIEPSFAPGSVYLFGAGHVSQQVAPLAKLVDFRIVVLDDRPEFANGDRFPGCDEVKTLTSFERALDKFEIDEDSYIVIVTRGHLHDKTVLEQALKTNAHYIGMIGSRKKRDRIFAELRDMGFAETDFQRVHAPIGTNIGAETPEEIGISIVGELIKARAARIS